MKHFNFLSNFRWFTTVILLITLGIGQMWAGTYSFDLHSVAAKSAGSNVSYWYSNSTCTTHCKTVDGSSNKISSCTLYYKDATITTAKAFVISVANDAYWFTGSPSKFFIGKSGSTITLPTFSGEKITNVRITTGAASSGKVTFCIKSGSYNASTNTSQTGAASSSFDFPITSTYQSTTLTFTITNANNINITDIIITTEAASSCDANPSIGTASLNGSISLSSIPLSISSVDGGTDCTLAEYGFVWKAGSAPSASDNKTKIGESSSATSFTGSITGSFSTSVTYYIKGYAINNGPNTTLSSTALTITPQSVTFNSNGGSSVSTAYVNNGATVSKPSNPTKTGYTFGTWQLSGSDYNFSTSVTGNITLDATWNAKTTAITLNKNNSDASGSTAGSASYTYGESTKNSYTAATRTGYTLNGYYTSTSAGTKILNADGSIAGSSIVVSTVTYTDGSGNWAYDNTALTLYAQWTIKNYTVTWKVNGEEYTAGTPTDNVNHGSHVTTLPTAPSTASYCGDKFMGWTDADGGVYTHGTSNLYTKASEFPNATTAQTFYAVFADYVAP